MSTMLWAITSAVCLGLATWFVVYPRIINDAAWYGFFSERMYLYAFPPFFAAAAFYSMREASREFGLMWADWFSQGTVGVTGLLMIVGLLAALGMPVPPFLPPPSGCAIGAVVGGIIGGIAGSAIGKESGEGLKGALGDVASETQDLVENVGDSVADGAEKLWDGVSSVF